MIKFRFAGANLYVKSGLFFLVVSAIAIATLVLMHPARDPARFLLFWLASGSFFGGIVLYLIGRIAYLAGRRDAA